MSALVDFGVPIGVAIIAVIGTLAGTWSGGRNEKSKWLREQRRDAYAELLRATGVMILRPDAQDEFSNSLHALSLVVVLGPADLASPAADLFTRASDYYHADQEQRTRDALSAWVESQMNFAEMARNAIA